MNLCLRPGEMYDTRKAVGISHVKCLKNVFVKGIGYKMLTVILGTERPRLLLQLAVFK